MHWYDSAANIEVGSRIPGVECIERLGAQSSNVDGEFSSFVRACVRHCDTLHSAVGYEILFRARS